MLIDGGPEGFIQTSRTLDEYLNPTKGIKKINVMDKEVTAQWARETGEKVLSKKVEAELEECEKKIKHAVSENEMTTTIFTFYGQKQTIKELESRGFKVKQENDQFNGSSLTISW